MMIRRNIFLILALLAVVSGAAQPKSGNSLEKFLTTYSSNFNRSLCGPILKGKIGDPMPAYDFGGGLNSKALKGKTVVLTYWTTWCGGCRLLCQDLDSVMFRHAAPGDYAGVQVIGVDADERLANKGYKATAWWKEKGIHFPTTAPGKAADDNAKAVGAGHPTTIIVDGEGIVRGRWEAWSPGVAGDVALAAWVLSDMPRLGIKADVPTVKKLMAENHYDRALYLLEQMPEDTVTIPLKMHALMAHSDGDKVHDYFVLVNQAYVPKDHGGFARSSDEHITLMKDFRDMIFQLGTTNTTLLNDATDAARVVVNNTFSGVTPHDFMKLGVLQGRYAENVKQRADDILFMARKRAQEAQQSTDEIDRYISELGARQRADEPMTLDHQRMMQDEKKQAEHMEKVK